MAELTHEERLEHIQGFLRSPIWVDILKPTITYDFNRLVKALVDSRDPDMDKETKAEIRAWGRLLDFERSAIAKITMVEREIQEAKERALASEPDGTPYAR